MKKKWLLVLVALCFNSNLLFAADIDMVGLMRMFSMNKSVKSEFVERKHIRILDTPIESKGELIFIAPSHLEKNTKSPRAESMVVEGNKVSIERGNFKKSLSLDDYPDFTSLVQSLTSTLRGDQTGLEKFFTWTLSGTAQKWLLVLKPKNAALFVQVREIRFAGENAFVYSIDTTLSDGDWSNMTLSRPVKTASP